MSNRSYYLPGFALLAMFVVSIPASKTVALAHNDDAVMLWIAAFFLAFGSIASLAFAALGLRFLSLISAGVVWFVVTWCISWFETYPIPELFANHANPALRVFLVIWAATPFVFLPAAYNSFRSFRGISA